MHTKDENICDAIFVKVGVACDSALVPNVMSYV